MSAAILVAVVLCGQGLRERDLAPTWDPTDESSPDELTELHWWFLSQLEEDKKLLKSAEAEIEELKALLLEDGKLFKGQLELIKRADEAIAKDQRLIRDAAAALHEQEALLNATKANLTKTIGAYTKLREVTGCLQTLCDKNLALAQEGRDLARDLEAECDAVYTEKNFLVWLLVGMSLIAFFLCVRTYTLRRRLKQRIPCPQP